MGKENEYCRQCRYYGNKPNGDYVPNFCNLVNQHIPIKVRIAPIKPLCFKEQIKE